MYLFRIRMHASSYLFPVSSSALHAHPTPTVVLSAQANLCYLEGMWTEAKSGSIDEPFTSDRHAIAAKSFFDLTVIK